jgi:glycerol-3-phosphate dehydrogenase (NAD(P)+)
MNISVLGCGRWGAFLAWYMNRCGFRVTLWGREGSPNLARLKEQGANEYLTMPADVKLTDDLKAAAAAAKVILVSVDAQALRAVLERLSACDISGKSVVLCIKGLEQSTGKRLSVVAKETIGGAERIAVWLGPGHVQDFTAGTPGCMVIDSENPKLVKTLCDKFSSKLIRFYYGTDIIGNEIGAAAKNVVGIAAGLLDGIHMQSLKGALMARGTREVSRLIEALAGDARSVYGLCHLGDYEATLFSPYSHNRLYGSCSFRERRWGGWPRAFIPRARLCRCPKEWVWICPSPMRWTICCSGEKRPPNALNGCSCAAASTSFNLRFLNSGYPARAQFPHPCAAGTRP